MKIATLAEMNAEFNSSLNYYLTINMMEWITLEKTLGKSGYY